MTKKARLGYYSLAFFPHCADTIPMRGSIPECFYPEAIMKQRTILPVLVACVLAATVSCGGGGSGGSSPTNPRFSQDDTTIASFTFPQSLNAGLPSDVSGTIQDNTISVTVPSGTRVNALVAEFATNQSTVRANGTVQQSGVTACDYSSPVTFAVTAASGASREYTVTVTIAPSDKKQITAFSIDSVQGDINESAGAISVSMPPHTSVISLVPSFEALAGSVTVNGAAQASGKSAVNFTSPVVYTAVAEDGSSKNYTVTVTVRKDTAKELTSFKFTKAENPSLARDCSGEFNDTAVSVTLPHGSSRENLIASFATTGDSVRIGTATQTSGETSNSFSSPVVYTITAEDGQTCDYTVTVTVAKNDAKAITRFELAGEAGVIDESAGTIAVTLPKLTNRASLVAAFDCTGASVTVGDAPQTSGSTANNFTAPVVYTVTAEDGSTKTYTVTAETSTEIIGSWGLDSITGDGFTVNGAEVVDTFDGSGLLFNQADYFLVSDSDDLTLASAGAIEIIFRIEDYKPFAGLVHKGVMKDFSDESYSLQFWSNNILRIILTGTGGATVYAETDYALTLGTWYHVVATWDESTLRLYVNNELASSVPNTIGAVRDSTGGLVIGAQLAEQSYTTGWKNLGFNGIINYVRVLNRAMTDDEVDTRFNDFQARAGSALGAYLIRAVSSSTGAVATVFAVLAIVLAALFVINRRRAAKSRQ